MSLTLANSNPVYIYGLYDPRDGRLRYIGKTCNLKARLRQHKADRKPCYRSNWIQSLVKQGLFAAMDVLEVSGESNWQEAERFWISYYKFIGCDLVNSTDGGDEMASCTPEVRKKLSLANIGKRHSLESRLKMSKSRRRENLSLETRAKMSLASKNRKASEETRRKISEANKGRNILWADKISKSQIGKIMSLESRKKMSLAKMGKKPWNYGKTMSEEFRRKLSVSHLGYSPKLETRKLLSESIKKSWANPEIRQKRMIGHERSCSSDGYKQKMSEAMKKFHRNKEL